MHYGLKNKDKNIYYPDIDDTDLYSKIYHKKEFYIHRQKKINNKDNDVDIMKEICNRRGLDDDEGGGIELLGHQIIVRNFISPYTPYKNLLVMHGTGSGKTLTGISVGEGFKHYIKRLYENTNNIHTYRYTIYIIGSQEAQNNFRDELLFKTNEYLTSNEKKELLELRRNGDSYSLEIYENKIKNYYKKLTTKTLGGFYKFMGYRDFQNRTIGEKIKTITGYKKDSQGKYIRKKKEPSILDLTNCLLIIDEAHNLVNSTEVNDYGKAIVKIYKKSTNIRMLLLTATPITHRPKEIIRLLNLVRLDTNEPKIKYGNIILNNNLTPDGEKILAEKSRGYISYLRGYNPYTYPKRIDMGVIPKSKEIKYTKLIRCPMSHFHYLTYEYHHKNFGKIKRKDESLYSMVFPNAYNNKLGLYRLNDIDNLRNASHEFLTHNNISFYQLSDGSLQITGDFLRKENIKKYSTKFYTLLENLDTYVNDNVGHSFIYTRIVKGAGSLLIKEILLRNGYLEFKYGIETNETPETYKNIKCSYCGILGKDHEKYLKKIGKSPHNYSPSRFILIESKSSEEKYITKYLIDEFNADNNKFGERIKVVIGSRVAREAIDFKRIKNIHVMTFDDNYAILEQIIGRGARHCSHVDLEPSQRYVRIYRYVNSMPDLKELSMEEIKYGEGEQIYKTIKKIERILKTNAVDCQLNRYGNIFDDEVQMYKNCETDKNPRLCSALCDFTNCDYKCHHSLHNLRELSFDDLDTTTYDLYHHTSELHLLKKYIKLLFKFNIVWTLSEIENSIFNPPHYLLNSQLIIIRNKLDYVDIKYIYLALNEIVENKENIINKFNNKGYVIYRGIYYIFQPRFLKETVTVEEREISDFKPEPTFVSIKNFIKKYYVKYKKHNLQEITIKNRINKYSISEFEKISKIIGNLSIHEQQKLLENAIIISNSPNITQDEKDYTLKIFKFFDKFIIDNKKFKGTYDYKKSDNIYLEQNKIIGHTLTKHPRCYIRNNWIDCLYEILSKKTDIRRYKYNNYIVGYIDKTKKGNIVFKLRYTTQFISPDKRRSLKGFVCSQHGDKNELIDIANHLGLDTSKIKNTIDDLCDNIEIKLRKNEINEQNKGSNIKWFIEYIELLRTKKIKY